MFDKNFQNAVAAYQMGQLDLAEELCHEILEVEADREEVWHLLAAIEYEKGNLSIAREKVEYSL